MQANELAFNREILLKSGIGTMLLILIILAMMVLPLPPFVLDVAFTFNISLALIVILAAVYSKTPLEFGSFPTVLLVSTLLRLALNVASTRVVLINGHTGGDAAGNVIEAFGNVVIGGNYAVGIVIFIILVVINFVVVTKGAGRISEVSARFTLDALPGKQMSIDADLNAGIISQEEAKIRREEIASEADFYGSMDGASKFVRGDAIAGIIILIVNLVGGVAIGILQHDLSFSMAIQNYALLTIGDGLVAQIPSLLLSTAAAIMVTRVTKATDMTQQVLFQLFASKKPLAISAIVLIFLGIIPNMPHIPFISLGLLLAGFAYYKFAAENQPTPSTKESPTNQNNMYDDTVVEDDISHELSWEDVPAVDQVGIELGYKLIALVDKNKKGELMARIKGVRKKLSTEFGFLIPSVHISDNLSLEPSNYQITIQGVPYANKHIEVDKDLAINPGQVFGKVDGIQTKDPAFDLDAVWIDKANHSHATSLGYTVVDPATVIATHLSQIVQNNAYQLLGHNEVQQMLDNVAKTSPKLIEELVPKTMSISVITKVMQNLLFESVPLRDVRTIVEALLEHGPKITDPTVLTEKVRLRLRNLIIGQITGLNNEVPVAIFSGDLEQILQKSIVTNEEGVHLAIEPTLAETINQSLNDFVNAREVAGDVPILLVRSNLRPILARLFKAKLKNLVILSYGEVPDNKNIKIINTLG